MAAKKAPAKNMAAPKKSGSAAQFRKAEEAGKKKMKGNGVDVSFGTYDTGKNKISKAGKDARGRASKYGTPVGKTDVYGMDQGSPGTGRLLFGAAGRDKAIVSLTRVKSARGNVYMVEETKTQKKLARDSKPVTDVYRTNQKRKPGQRDAKFGPAPKKKK